MKVSVSILGIKDDINKIKIIDDSSCDFIHLDVMDGKFVSNSSSMLFALKKNKDIHLMVNDIKKYVDIYKELDPEYITFHIEAAEDPIDIINYIKSKNCKVGLSIKPNTSINSIIPYLSEIDLVLIMSVEPGYGGQEFLDNSIQKVNYLDDIRKKNRFKYVIEVDGGINNKNIEYIKKADIAVVGSYITNFENIEERIENIR